MKDKIISGSGCNSFRDVCDGTFEDCVAKGKEECMSDSLCTGISVSPTASGTVQHNGFIRCRANPTFYKATGANAFMKRKGCSEIATAILPSD